MFYIQRKDSHSLETVDQFDTRKEAHLMLTEYQMADPTASHYVSARPCNAWREPIE